MTYAVRFAHRAEKDLARLDRDAQKRIARRASELGNSPNDPRLSRPLTQQGRLRKSRIGGWRIIYAVDERAKVVTVVTIERRGQVYKRL